jgi:hypothetical protein
MNHDSIVRNLISQLPIYGRPDVQYRKAFKIISNVIFEFKINGLSDDLALFILSQNLYYIDYYDLLHRGYNHSTCVHILDILKKLNLIHETEKDALFLDYLSKYMIPSELMVNIKNDAKDIRLNNVSFDIYKNRNYRDWSIRKEPYFYISTALTDEDKFDIIQTANHLYGYDSKIKNKM